MSKRMVGHDLKVSQLKNESTANLPTAMLKTFCNSFVFFLLVTLSAVQAAQLTDVRVGVHPRFTRIVFEMNGESIIEGPVHQGPERSSLKLINTKNALKTALPSYAKANVDSIDLIHDGEDLIAHIRMAFPYFKIRSFFLPNPQRVVLDIYQITENTLNSGNQKLQFDVQKSRPTQEKRPVSDTRENNPAAVVALPTQEAPIQVKGLTDSLRSTQNRHTASLNAAPPNREPVSIQEQPEPALKRLEKQDPALPDPAQKGSFLQSETALQIYLVVVLFFSVLTLSLLFFLVFRKEPGKAKGDFQNADSGYKMEKTLEVIDKRINDRLYQLSRKLRLKGS